VFQSIHMFELWGILDQVLGHIGSGSGDMGSGSGEKEFELEHVF